MRFSRLFSVALCFVLSAVAEIAQASGGSALMKQIKEATEKVRADKTVDARTEAAEHLASLIQKLNSKAVTEALVTDVESLLDSPDDSVRYWVATALGNMGPAAKVAVPQARRNATQGRLYQRSDYFSEWNSVRSNKDGHKASSSKM